MRKRGSRGRCWPQGCSALDVKVQDVPEEDYLSTCIDFFPIWPSIYLPIYPRIYRSIDLSVYRSTYLSIYLSICLSIYRSICQSAYLPIDRSMDLFRRLFYRCLWLPILAHLFQICLKCISFDLYVDRLPKSHNVCWLRYSQHIVDKANKLAPNKWNCCSEKNKPQENKCFKDILSI